jgi:hypothetical protein
MFTENIGVGPIDRQKCGGATVAAIGVDWYATLGISRNGNARWR